MIIRPAKSGTSGEEQLTRHSLRSRRSSLRTVLASRQSHSRSPDRDHLWRRARIEALEPRLAMAANFVISEFMADNDGFLLDNYGTPSDWIEIHNQGNMAGSLNGYYLTDKVGMKTQWQFPDVTVPAGGYLLVFASNQDDRVIGQPLHTNFALAKEGEYLGLIAPNGTTLVHEYAPAYPQQEKNVSYGLGQFVTELNFVPAGAAAKTLVPTNSSYDAVWKSPSYVPDANWTSGTTGIGFGQTFNGFLVRTYRANVAAGSPIGTGVDNIDEALDVIGDATLQTSSAAGNFGVVNFNNNQTGGNYGNNVAFPGLTLATNVDNFVTEAHALVTIPAAGDWTFGVHSNEGYLLVVDDFTKTRSGVGSSDNPEFLTVNFATAGVYDLHLYNFERTGSSWLELFAAPGIHTSFNSSVFRLVGDTATGGLQVKADLVGSNGASINQLLGTNIQNQMLGVNSTFYTRIAFNVTNPAALDQLKLRMRYDDAFVAYLNGTSVASRNVTGQTVWNSVANSSRGDEALVAEEIDLAAFLSSLVVGQNLLAIQGLNFAAGNPDALVLPELLGVDIVSGAAGYFTTPTPGATNNSGVLGFVEDTQFSVDRGFFDAPFQVAITTATPGTEIYYTTNGDAPTQGTGTLYTGPININRTTTLRAAAFKAGFVPTNVDTQTYLFINDIVQQNFQATLNAGFPSTWGSFTGVDYGFDPDVIGNFNASGNPTGGDLFGGAYAATIKNDLLSLPTMSIVLDVDDMFGPQGIYSNPTQRGTAWERATSVEWITTDGSSEFQVDAGIQIQGAFFRSNNNSRKHSFRLLFKDIYGPGKFNFPFFGSGAVDEFNTLVLRAGANDSYSWNSARYTEQYTRDQFGRDLQRDSGIVSPHGKFAHLYINGVYWGLYNPVERPDEEFAASYFGGEPENWDVVHRGGGAFEVQNGDLVAWNAMLAKAVQAGTSLAAYRELQGKNLDGTPHATTAPLLDVASYAKYIAVNAWGGNYDWPRNNFFAARDKDPLTTTGWEFFGWDIENTIGNNRSRSPLTADVFDPTKLPGNDFTGSDNAGQPHVSLLPSAEYKLLFADAVQKMLFNDGILTPAKLIERYQALAGEIDQAMVAESARWGDMHFTTQPLTPADWITERNWLLNTYLPQRSAIVLNQFKTYSLYPNVNAPIFSQFGGNYAGGFNLSITNPNSGGTIYYTLDGSDPRVLGGALNPSAKTYSGPIELLGGLTVKARYRSAGGVWSALVEAPFTQNAIGLVPGDFNRDGNRSATDIASMMQSLVNLNGYQTVNGLSASGLTAIGDVNADQVVGNADLQALITRLIGSGSGSGTSSGPLADEAPAPLADTAIIQSTTLNPVPVRNVIRPPLIAAPLVVKLDDSTATPRRAQQPGSPPLAGRNVDRVFQQLPDGALSRRRIACKLGPQCNAAAADVLFNDLLADPIGPRRLAL